MSVSLKSIWNASISNIDNILKSQHIEELDDVMKYITISKLYSKSNQLSREESEIVNNYNFTKAMLQTRKYSHKKRLNEGLRIFYEINQSDKIVSSTILSSDIRSTKKQLELLKSDLHASRKLKRLSGIVSFVYFNNIPGGKRLLLLGELHQMTNLCKNDSYEVHRWLYELIQHAPECTDLFVEDELFSEDDEIYTNPQNKELNSFEVPLEAIRKTFSSCYRSNSNNCPLSKLRYHYVDSRRIYGNRPDLTTITVYRDELSEEFYIKAKHYLELHKREIFDYYSGYNRSDKCKKIYEKYLTILTTNSEIEFTPGSGYFGGNNRKNYMNLIDKEISKIQEPFNIDNFFNILYLCYVNIESYSSNIFESVPMDVYFLLRYLHTYNIEKMDRGQSFCRDLKYVEHLNSIVYGGDFHVKIYALFFKEYFKINPVINVYNKYNEIIHNDISQCLTLPEYFDFYESN